MPTYRVNLEDGRQFDLESEREPTSDEAYGALMEAGHVERPKEDLGISAGVREGLKSYPSLEAGGIAAAAAQPVIAPLAAATGPFAPVTEALLSGGVALAGTISARWAQDKALDAIIPKDTPLLNQLRSDQTKKDVTEHPTSTMVGSLFSGGTPNLYNLARTGKTVANLLDSEGSSLIKKAYTATKSETLTNAFLNEARNATDLKARKAAIEGIRATIQVGVNSGIFGGQALIEGRPIDEVLTEAAIGAAFTGHGPGHLLKEVLSSNPQSTEAKPSGKMIDLDDEKQGSPQSVITPTEPIESQQSTETPLDAPQAPSAVSTPVKDPIASQTKEIGNESQLEGESQEGSAEGIVSPQADPIDSERKEYPQSTESLEDLNKQLLDLGSNSAGKDKYFDLDRQPSIEERKKIASQGDRVKAAAYRDANGDWHAGWSFEDAMGKGGVSKEDIVQKKDKLTKDLGFIVESEDGKLRIVNRKEAKVVAAEAGQLHHDLYLPSRGVFRNLRESHLYDAMEGLGEGQETPKIGPDESSAKEVKKKASEQIDSAVIDPSLSPIAIEAAKAKLESQLTKETQNERSKNQPEEKTDTEPEPFGIPSSTVAKDATSESQSEEDLALARGKKPLPKDSKIIGATYTDPASGRVYVGSNHLDAMGKSGADTKNYQTRASREKPQFGFKILHPDGTSEVIGRREAGRLAVENKQIKSDAKVPKHGKMHSDHVNFHDVPPETLDTLSLSEAGFESKEEFDKAFEKDGRKDVNETQEEFLQRIYCK